MDFHYDALVLQLLASMKKRIEGAQPRLLSEEIGCQRSINHSWCLNADAFVPEHPWKAKVIPTKKDLGDARTQQQHDVKKHRCYMFIKTIKAYAYDRSKTMLSL